MSKFFREQDLPISKLVPNKPKPNSQEFIEEIKVDYFEPNSEPNCLELSPQKPTTAIVPNSKLDNSTNLLWSKLKEQLIATKANQCQAQSSTCRTANSTS